MSRQAPTRQFPQTSLFPFFLQAAKEPRTGIGIAVAYALVMTVVALKYHLVGDYGVETDFFWSYVPEAKKVLRGTFVIEDFRGSGYPTILAGAFVLFRDYFRAGILLSVLAASGTLFLTFEILRRLFRADVAIVGTALVALNRTFIQYSYSAGTDMVFNFLVTATVYFLLKDEQKNPRNMIISGLLAGVAYLTRYNGVFVLLAVPVIVLLIDPYRLAWRDRMKSTAVFLGVFLLTITPWGIYCLIEKGSFFYNRNYLNIAYEMFAKGKVPWDQYWNVEVTKYASLGSVILADPGLFAATLAKNLYEHLIGDLGLLLGWQAGVLVFFGLLLSFREKPTRGQAAFYVYGGSFFLVLLLVFYGERFSLFLLPVYVTLTLKALTWQRLAGFRFWNRIHIGALACYVLILWSFSDAYSFNRENIGSGPKEIPVIAQWFISHGGDGEAGKTIICRKPHIAYYLNMEMASFPYVNTIDELREEVKRAGASYLFFGLMEAGMRPQFQQLLDPANAPAWLRPVTYTVAPPAVLYKVETSPSP
ncbi:MAG: glycosyltransferase family 39 protein [Bacteroidota bacterium]